MPFEAEQHAVLPGRMCCFRGICNDANEDNAKAVAKVFNNAITIEKNASGTVTAVKIGSTALASDGENPDYYTFNSGVETTVKDAYYLVTSSLGSNLVLATSNITIKEKNDYIKDEKTVETASVTIGEKVTYYIKVILPASIDVTKDVTVHDQMAAELGLDKASLKAYVTHDLDGDLTALGEGKDIKDLTYSADNEYLLKVKADGDTVALDADTFNIVIPAAKVAALMDAHKDGSTYRPVTVIFQYKAELLSTADVDGDGYVNKEFSTYSDYTTKETEPKVKTYGFKVNKKDGNNQALAGAEFELRSTAADPATAYTFLAKATGDVYKKADSDDTAATNTTTLVGGSFTVKGFGAGQYYLVETKEPAGYNKLTDPIIIAIDDAGGVYKKIDSETFDSAAEYYTYDTTEKKATKLEDVTSENFASKVTTGLYVKKANSVATEFDVINQSGTALPSTGGIGTTIFYVLGAALVIGAGVLLVTRRRMNND